MTWRTWSRRPSSVRRSAASETSTQARVEEALAAEVTARGQQTNLSFFAFTATPKGKTLELFGRLDPATNRHLPFHLYSMRQAIEEGFIEDVLAQYAHLTRPSSGSRRPWPTTLGTTPEQRGRRSPSS